MYHVSCMYVVCLVVDQGSLRIDQSKVYQNFKAPILLTTLIGSFIACSAIAFASRKGKIVDMIAVIDKEY